MSIVPKIIGADTRKSVGSAAARAGEIVARRLFEARGNHTEAHLSELELAMIAATAAHLAIKAYNLEDA